MDIIIEFLEFERQQTKILRDNKIMYDVKGYYKYLDSDGLFKYFMASHGKIKNIRKSISKYK